MSHHISLMLVACLSYAGTVMAEATTYHCKGVNYLYDSGIGTGGKARRVSSARTLVVDLEALTAKVKEGDAVSRTPLELQYGVYQGFIPRATRVSGTAVRGVVLEFHPRFRSLELKYELEDERHFLAFTGRCGVQ